VDLLIRNVHRQKQAKTKHQNKLPAGQAADGFVGRLVRRGNLIFVR
jgi:hypothetical protein